MSDYHFKTAIMTPSLKQYVYLLGTNISNATLKA